MKNKLKIIIVFLLIINMNLFTGCWDYREVDTLGIVSGIAVDKSTDGKNYLVSFEVIKIGSGRDAKTTTELIKSEGKTIFDATRNAIMSTGKKLYFSHAKVLIIGNEVAKEGTANVLDFFKRHVETRRDIGVYISKGKNAYDIFEQKTPLADILSLGLNQMQLSSGIDLSKSSTVLLWNYISDLSSEGISAILPTIIINDQSGKLAPHINGTAIFKKDKLIGYLDGDETNTMLYIQNKNPKGLVVFINDAEKSRVSMEIMNDNVEIKPKVTNGKVLMNIIIKMEVSIGENASSVEYMKESNRIILEQNVANQLRSNIVNLVKKVQNDYDSDIFGFGKTIKKELPNEWRKMSKDWDNLFKQVDVEVEAEVKIKNTGLSSRAITVGD